MYHSTEYHREFWNAMRGKKHLSQGTALQTERNAQNGSYRLPYESDNKFVALRQKENLFRRIGTVVNATKGDSVIWAFDNDMETTWITDKNPSFFKNVVNHSRYRLESHTLGCATYIAEDFLNDAGFDVEALITKEFAKGVGRTEEAACITGDGATTINGFLQDALIGHTTADITYDDVIRLFFSLDQEYRRNGVWVMNNETALKLRTLKDNAGSYIWNHSDSTILGKPVYISDCMPSEAAGARPIAFGDFSYFWIVDRMPFALRELTEVLALQQQIGFVGYETIDAKLIRPEAIRVLEISE